MSIYFFFLSLITLSKSQFFQSYEEENCFACFARPKASYCYHGTSDPGWCCSSTSGGNCNSNNYPCSNGLTAPNTAKYAFCMKPNTSTPCNTVQAMTSAIKSFTYFKSSNFDWSKGEACTWEIYVANTELFGDDAKIEFLVRQRNGMDIYLLERTSGNRKDIKDSSWLMSNPKKNIVQYLDVNKVYSVIAIPKQEAISADTLI